MKKNLTVGQRIVCLITIFAGFCLIGQGLASVNAEIRPGYLIALQAVHPATYPVKKYLPIDNEFMYQCLRGRAQLCLENRGASDFLYNDNEIIQVIKNEEANLDVFDPKHEKGIKLAALVEKNIQLKLPAYDETVFTQMENLNQTILYQLYEEELPNDIIDDKGNSQYIHDSHKNIKDIKFLPEKKPYYFGPKPVIAIVIDDMGISHKRTAEIYKIKAPLTASFLTYGRKLNEQMDKSREAGQEIMLHVPMEAMTTKDAAPDVLTTAMSREEIEANLENMLKRFQNIKGINNHMGSKMTANEHKMGAVMNVLHKHGLFFLDSKTSALSKAGNAAEKHKVAYAHRHVFLDNQNDKAYILKQLELTEKLAQKNGYAIAIGHPKTQTAAALSEWLDSFDNKEFALVHLSEIVKVLNPRHYTALQ